MAIDPQKLSEAVVHWLEYESAIGRADLFDEAYLAYPLGTYLQVHGGGRVKPEELHPVLNKNPTGKGRKASVDFVIAPDGSTVWDWAIETKFVTDNRDFSQEVFDDILRLECLVAEFKAARFLFVLAGRSKLVNSLLVKKEGQVGGGSARQPLFPSVLSIDPTNAAIEVQIENSTEPQRSYWKDAVHANVGGWPVTLTTKLLGLTGTVDSTKDSFVCMAWEIIPTTRPLVHVS